MTNPGGPLQIVWGEGKIRMEEFSDNSDGSFGLILTEAPEPHPVGETFKLPPVSNHMPTTGEFYLRFKNVDGLRALIKSLSELRPEESGNPGGEGKEFATFKIRETLLDQWDEPR